MTNCKHCDKPITKSSPGVQCHGQCAAHFHANNTCSDVSKSQISTLESLPGARWMCKPCRGQRARTTSIDLEEMNETQVIDFMRKMKTELHAEMKDLKRAVDFCSDKISDFESKLAKLNEYIKKTDQLQKENIKLKQDINSLESKMNSLESSLRCNNVEIQDVPEKTNESLISVVQDIGKFLQYEIKESAIDTVFRVQTQVENKPKNIVVKFISKVHRDGFLNAAKVTRMIKEHQRGFKLPGVSERFYINEHLLPQTKLLLKQVREFSKSKSYKFVWVQNGNVLLRKAERSKIFQVRNVDDLGRLE